MPSTAPAAPIRWPVIDFVPLMAISGVRSPKTAQKACASRRSPSGVDVPWGLIRSISSRGTPWRSRAISMARRVPSPFSTGWMRSHASAAEPKPTTSA